jgi:hypothetical protein
VNAPPSLLAGQTLEAVRHIAQDLRAEVHRVPEDVAKVMRSAAIVCDAYAALRVATGDFLDSDPQPAPIGPPLEDEPCN